MPSRRALVDLVQTAEHRSHSDRVGGGAWCRIGGLEMERPMQPIAVVVPDELVQDCSEVPLVY